MKKKEEVVKKTKKDKILTEDYDIAYDFAIKAYKRFQEIVKCIVLFGSTAKLEATKKSDIDLIIIVDDASIVWDQELIAWYREELGKLVANQDYKKDLHINTVTLSIFWEEVKAGEPVVINVLRYGQALVDYGGFFAPLKVLLAKGRIRPTPEAVYTTLRRGPEHIQRAKIAILSAIDNLYWSMVDSAHAALMANNEVPPSPEHIAEMLYESFVKKGMLDKKYVNWYEEVRTLTKNIVHGNIKDLKGKEVDEHIEKVIEFEKTLRILASKLIADQKIIQVNERKR